MESYAIQCLLEFDHEPAAYQRSALERMSGGHHFAGHEWAPSVSWVDSRTAIVRFGLKGPHTMIADPEDTVCRSAEKLLDGWLRDSGIAGGRTDCKTIPPNT